MRAQLLLHHWMLPVHQLSLSEDRALLHERVVESRTWSVSPNHGRGWMVVLCSVEKIDIYVPLSDFTIFDFSFPKRKTIHWGLKPFERRVCVGPDVSEECQGAGQGQSPGTGSFPVKASNGARRASAVARGSVG